SEGGSIAEEVYVRNVVDRVETTATVMLGLTVGCARCHDHKFDPVTQKDFYSLFAFFNSIAGDELDGNIAAHPPVVKVASPEQLAKLKQLKERVADTKKRIAEAVAKVDYDPAKDPADEKPLERQGYVWIQADMPKGAKAQGNTEWQWVKKPEPVYSGERASKRKAEGLSQHFFDSAPVGLTVGSGDKLFAYVYLDPKDLPREIMLQWHT